MGRMHSNGKGVAQSAIPYNRSAPEWAKMTTEELNTIIAGMARKGVNPSRIGTILRDQHGVGQIHAVTGNKIVRMLRSQGLAPEIPEDLYMMIKRAVSIRKHIERNPRDKDSKYRLILIESRIHRLSRYYRATKKVAPSFKYEAATANQIVA
ncbi:Ribosomal protein S15 [Carpediemonas membranifera]|uniref:Ribosomal protein S15 n=1 Tax=Carpediemonas membranifera TaxID=201153 RepID=A0A8J6E3Z4_9EUKA|nr:Ribosomal protein S15 [Carpediemonas membranifera]KAG9394791.1 Ribosomal protein S15 [Carpediemonas membranifera]|eukprot:KAG9393817.1 Ribosomal protein S15 [Carpediemonas membranifera]